MSASPQILFIAPTRIGDAVLAAALLRYIHETQPTARVTIATSQFSEPLYLGYPALERIIPMVKRRCSLHWLELWKQVATTRWDAVWDMRGSALSYMVHTNARYNYRSPEEAMPKLLQFEKALGLPTLPNPALWPTAQDSRLAAQLLPDGTPYLILAPTANWAPKEWPMAHFIRLAQTLFDGALHGFRPVIICAEWERERVIPLLDACAQWNPIDLTRGNNTLLTLYACMQRARGFVGNDSGLMHMAAAADIPTIGLFGPTNATIYRPTGDHAEAVCAPDADMAKLLPEQVVARLLTRMHIDQ